MKQKILIVDDEKLLRDTLAEWFSVSYDCLTAPDAEQALKTIAATPDLALMISDVKMPPEGERSGVELLKKAKALKPDLACILLTAYGTVDLAVEAMKDGADDFFQKPVTDLAQFELRVAKALRNVALDREAAAQATTDDELADFTGKSPAMEKVYRLIRKVAPTDATVLIGGPSGTGKELTAKAIHNLSRRANGPFVAVECASLPPTLLETELFGSVKGAYTDARDRKGCFESAHGGTLFLDEIGDIELSAQVKLLRVLETRTFQRVGESVDRPADFRLVAASNQDFRKLIAEGKFREDLYYRLNVIDIHLPALKDRPGDIPLLADRFLKEFSAANGNTVTGFAPETLKRLEAYPWPGNVRQLRNAVEKMVVLANGPLLTVEDLPTEIAEAEREMGEAQTSPDPQPPTPNSQLPTPNSQLPTPNSQLPTPNPQPTLADNEKRQILETLEACKGNKSRAADVLGISRRTLHRKLKEWGLS